MYDVVELDNYCLHVISSTQCQSANYFIVITLTVSFQRSQSRQPMINIKRVGEMVESLIVIGYCLVIKAKIC